MPAEFASGLWRSEDMQKMEVMFQREAVHDSLFAIGRLGIAQFCDLQKGVTAFQRAFTPQIRRCDDLERRLRFFQEQMRIAEITPTKQVVETRLRSDALDQLETILESQESELRELNGAMESLQAELNSMREYAEVMNRNVLLSGTYQGLNEQMLPAGAAPTTGVLYVAGVVPEKHIHTLIRLVFRVSRGNCVVHTDYIQSPFVDIDGNKTFKHAFIIYGTSQRLIDKIIRICDSLGANTYRMATDAHELAKVDKQMASLTNTIDQTMLRKRTVLKRMATSFEAWYYAVLAEKAIFTQMNLMEFRGSLVKAELWVASSQLLALKDALEEGAERAGAEVRSVLSMSNDQTAPPTYFQTNKITESFQGIVDSYGVPHYKEVNPGVLTIVTFPYLFGIMYGDMGHGALLTLIAGFLILMETKLAAQKLNEIVAMIFGGRYLLFGMGLFAIYLGMLYNDFFGFSLGLFESGYKWPSLPHHGGPQGIVHPISPNGKPSVKPMAPVAFGIDVAWTETENKLEFYNSIKMKCAVIVGVVQMMVGIILSALNFLREKNMMKFWFLFVPELIFLSFTFGYMSLLIIIKWLMVWNNTNHAPSLLETMTNFFLQPGNVTVPLFSGQAALQVVLLLVAYATVPVMLLVVPLREKAMHKKRTEHLRPTSSHTKREPDERLPLTEDIEAQQVGEEHGGEFDFGEVMIHYIIHTIEFVLGCVSNTASYLRLWALSLAHAQLSEVFFNFGFLATLGMDSGNGIILMVGFAIWLGATLMVLLMMEALSAFLHALRLHWVEFQNKFFAADGIAFEPFDLGKEMKFAD